MSLTSAPPFSQVINSTADYSQVKWSVEQGKDKFQSKLAETTAHVEL